MYLQKYHGKMFSFNRHYAVYTYSDNHKKLKGKKQNSIIKNRLEGNVPKC